MAAEAGVLDVTETPVTITKQEDAACEGGFLVPGSATIESAARCALFSALTDGMSDRERSIAFRILNAGDGPLARSDVLRHDEASRWGGQYASAVNGLVLGAERLGVPAAIGTNGKEKGQRRLLIDRTALGELCVLAQTFDFDSDSGVLISPEAIEQSEEERVDSLIAAGEVEAMIRDWVIFGNEKFSEDVVAAALVGCTPLQIDTAVVRGRQAALADERYVGDKTIQVRFGQLARVKDIKGGTSVGTRSLVLVEELIRAEEDQGAAATSSQTSSGEQHSTSGDEEPAGWQDYGNCRGVDPDLFFPERGASTREAKEVCKGCVVREDCLEYALAKGEKFGIWGGLSERERRRIRRQRAFARRAAAE